MNTDLLGFVQNCLRTRQVPLTEVAKGSGVPYDTLKKIASGATPNPGVKHVQTLAEFFERTGQHLSVEVQNQKPTPAPAHQALAATESVVVEVAHG